MSHLLQRHELRRPRRTDARPAVLHGPPGHRELPQIVPIISGLISTVSNAFPLWTEAFLPTKSGKIGTSRQCVRSPFSCHSAARNRSTKIVCCSSRPRRYVRRGRAGRSSMTSCRVIAFISSRVYPRYVNSRFLRTSTPAARFLSFLRAAFASPPIFFATVAYLLPRFSLILFGTGPSRPTLRPGDACHDTVEGLPTCWWAPPPWGWSTGLDRKSVV